MASHAPSNGTSHVSSATFKGTWTDSDGNYTLTNLAAGSFTISPNLYPNVFAPSNFTNPVVVGPSTSNINFGSTTLPTITLNITDAIANEGATPGTGTIRIERTGSNVSALSVQIFNSNTGTATRNTDYSLSPAPTASTAGGGSGTSEYIIPAGASFLDITVTPVNDSTAEGSEYASLDFANTSGGYILAGSAVAQVEIVDDENGSLPVVKLTHVDNVASESGGDIATLKLERNGSTAANLTVNLTMTGTATNITDYTIPASVVIPSGSASTTFTLTPVDDIAMEGTETAIVTIATNAAYARDALANNLTVTIHDNDLPVVTIAATDATLTEPPGDKGVFTISRSGGDSYLPLTVDYAISGRAVHGADYRRLEGRAVIPAGASSTTVEIYPYDDSVDEGTQDIILRLRSTTTYVIGSTGTATMSITDNDDSQIYLKVTQSGVIEPATGSLTAVTYQIIRPATGSAITVNYAMSGTAINGVDYTSLPGTIAFTAAETTKTINVAALADTLFEDAESVTLTLLPGTGYNVMSSQLASLTGFILDGDQPTIDVSAADTVTSLTTAGSETSASLRFIVSRKTATATDLIVNYTMSGTATEGVDYTGTTGSVTILANTVSAYITIVPVNDTIAEGVESIVMNVTPASGTYGLRTATSTMLLGDNDAFSSGSVAFGAATSSINEAAGTHNVPVNVTGTPSGTITVSYRLSAGTAMGGGYDFTMNEGVLTFPSGTTTLNIPITIHPDNLAEPAETIALQLYNVSGGNLGTSTHTVTLNNLSMPEAFTDAASNLLATSVTLNGRVMPNGLATNVWFEYGPTAAYGSSTAPQAIGSGTTSVAFNAALSGFAPGGYHFRSVAQNSAGTTYGINQIVSSNNANLSNLITNVGTWTPVFDAATTSYSVTVPSGTTSINVTPTVAQGNATVKINGVTVASGSASSSIAIGSGTTVINAVVTAQDGVTLKTYTLNVSLSNPTASYSLTYNGNGNNGGSAPIDASSPYLSDSTVTVLGNTGSLTRTGYAFVGWSTAPNGGGTNYTTGSTFTISGNITLYARWNNLPSVNAGPDQTLTLTNATWQPSNLSIQAWYDASDASTITASGGLVSEWRDKSGFNRHATQPTGANQPSTGTNTMGGLNVISLNGTSQFFNADLDYLAGSTHSAFIVTKATAFRNIYGAANGSAGANSLHVGFSSSTQFRMNFWGNDFNLATASSFIPTSGNVLNYVWTPGVSKEIFANGSLQGTTTSAGSIGTMAGGGRIGNVVGQGLYGGDIAEIIFVTGTVSAADRERMEGYLAHKWQMQAQLPAGHPYKNVSPIAPVAVVTLDGTVSDADPADTVSSTWTLQSSPNGANAMFENASTVDTTVSLYQTGVYTLRLAASDGVSNVFDEATITINPPLPPNTAPAWTGNPIAELDATEDVDYASTLADNATDAEGNTLSFVKVSGPAWLTVAANGDLSGTPANSDVGANSYTVSVSDGIAPAVEATLNIFVINVNDAPTWASNPFTSADASEDAAYTGSIAGSANDVDTGAILTFVKVSGPAWLSVSSTGDLSGTPTNSDVGTSSFIVSVSDGIAPAVEATLNISVINTNDAPTWTVNPITGADAAEDAAFTGSIAGSAIDVDLGDSLTFAKVSGPTWLIVSPTGALSGTPTNSNVGANSFTVSVSDGIAAPVNATLNISIININDAPTWIVNPITGANATEDAAYSGNISGNSIDVDLGASLTFAKVSGPSWLSVSPMGDLSGTPTNSDVGTSSFTVSVSDGIAAPVNATLNITVINTNDAPTWTVNPITGADASEDAAYIGSIAGSANDEDAGTALTFAKVSGPAWLIVSPTGALSGTPTNSNVGASSFIVSVSDGIVAPVNATLNISVININDAPTWANNPLAAANAAEDEAYTGSIAGSASDVDLGASLTFAKVSGPAWLSVSSTGDLSGTPPNSNVGTNSFTVSVSDGIAAPVNATLNITVINTNDAPTWTVNPIAGTNASEDVAYTGSIAGMASDVDPGATLTFAKISGPAWLTISSTGALSGMPANSNVGANSFTVSVSDGIAAPINAILNITVSNTNDAPTWAGNPLAGANATEDAAYTGSIAGSASDVDLGAALTFAKVSGPAWLSVSSTGALSGTPTNSNVGANSFTVSVSDGIAAPVNATLNITVINTNDAPTFITNPIIAVDATEGVAYTGVTLAGSATDSDVGDTLTFSKVSGPTWLIVAANGALSGTPPAGSAGLNSFIVRATDPAAASVDATLQITVVGLPLPWLAADIGTGMLAGSTSFNAGTFTQAGSGIIGGTSSKLRFTYQTLSGDGEIIARITSLQNTGNSSRVGVIIRESLAANSKEIFMGLSGSNAYRWDRRTTTGGTTTSSSSKNGTVPSTWVRLVRTGTTITAYKSTNGTSWTTVGSTTGTTFAVNCYIGLAVSSGSDTTLNTSQFSNLSVTP